MLGFTGNDAEEKMIDYLETHGTMMLVNRYPDIRDKSVVNTRMFLDRNAPSGSTSISAITLAKINGDSDGDSISKMLLQRYGVDYTAFDKIRRDSTNFLNVAKKDTSFENVRKTAIETLVDRANTRADDLGLGEESKLSLKQGGEIFDFFTKLEAAQTLESVSNLDIVAEEVLSTMFKDEAKNFELSTVAGAYDISKIKNIGAQVEGGKSILGKIRLSNLEQAAGALDIQGSKFYFDSTNKINSYMSKIADNKDVLLQEYGIDLSKYDYIKDLSPTNSRINLYNYGTEQHGALDEILSIIEKDTGKDGKNLLNINHSEALDTITNRIRSDIYNQNSISKTNKGVIGQVNASLYALRQAHRDVMNPTGAESNFKDAVVQALGYDMEEHVISSKKEAFQPGDERLVNLVDILTDSKGIHSNKNQSDVAEDVSDWITRYMKSSKIESIYKETFSKEGAPTISKEVFDDTVKEIMSIKGLSQKDATVRAKADYLSKTFVESIRELMSSEEGRNTVDLYSVFGRRSGSINKLENKVDINNVSSKSFNSTALFLGYGKKPDEKIIYSPNKNLNNLYNTINVPPKVNNLSKLSQDASKIIENLSSSGGLGMGVLGLAAGLLISGYASGNPLNDPKNDKMENRPQEINNMSVPDFFDKEGGFATLNQNQKGYVINIKADTRRGQRYSKKAMKQAISASTGGAVNINMNFKSNNSGGYSDKDIDDILTNYI